MTIKLYDQQPYLKEAKAKVIEVFPGGFSHEGTILNEKKGRLFFEVELDSTIFYPEGGGQPSDIGWIDGEEVSYVREEGGRIFHQMAKPPQKEEVTLSIDWQRRYDHMQQHTGEHVVSGLFLKVYDAGNKGFHLGENYVTVDIDLPRISQEMLETVEIAANEAIWGNQGIRWDITSQQELEKFPIRKRITAEGVIRVVTIEDIDCCACCGTHVATLSEVGLVKLIRTESYKGMTRVYLISGKRALKDYGSKSGILQKLRQFYSTEEEKLLEAGEKLRGEMSQTRKDLQSCRKSLAEWMIKAASAENEAGIWQLDEGLEVLTVLEEQIKKQWTLSEKEDPGTEDVEKRKTLKEGVAVATKRALLLSRTENKIIAFSQDPQDEIGAFFKAHLRDYEGKGGGSKERAQASFESTDSAVAFVNRLKEHWALP